MHARILSLLFVFWTSLLFGQTFLEVHLEPLQISGLGGVQSYAVATHEGDWLIMGGRLDGLHRRQPWASFDEAGNNNQLIVVNPEEGESWSASISSLETNLREQLSSTNPEFYQQGDYLYVIGGYGFSPSSGDHITHPQFTAVDVPAVINAVKTGGDLQDHFRQVEDELFAVTGGYLDYINGTYYLVGGQRFDGAYNPMNNPTFVQEYTNAIRRFTLVDDGEILEITHLEEWYDAANLHRRDYNVVSQIMPDGSFGLTAFSGVFNSEDLPWLNSVDISAGGYTVNDDFTQYYNHYHCAHIPMYSSSANEMHTIFFGGMAQFYEVDGGLIQDDNVPFVRTIAQVTRSADGSMAEYKLDTEMPDLLGASAEFIAIDDLPTLENRVIDLDALEGDSILLGYIYGGIRSTDRNIFWINNGTQSEANSELLAVYLVMETLSTNDPNEKKSDALALTVYPNPSTGDFTFRFNLKEITSIEIELIDETGKQVFSKGYSRDQWTVGENELSVDLDLPPGNYTVRFTAGELASSQKVILVD
jgi:hypothetical protein